MSWRFTAVLLPYRTVPPALYCRYSIERSRYNAVLTGAAFLDTQTALPAYWADEVAPARATGAVGGAAVCVHCQAEPCCTASSGQRTSSLARCSNALLLQPPALSCPPWPASSPAACS
jgi:hypothetical protein